MIGKEKEKKKYSYFRQVQQELKKVSWTSKKDIIFFTKVVLMATFLMGLTIYVADISIREILSLLSFLSRMIVG